MNSFLGIKNAAPIINDAAQQLLKTGVAVTAHFSYINPYTSA